MFSFASYHTLGQKEAVFSFTSFISSPPLVTGGKNIHYGRQQLGPPHSAFATLKETKVLKTLLSQNLAKSCFCTLEAEILLIL